MLDKLLGLWYNGNSGRWGRRRHAQKRPMGLFIPQVIGPILNPNFRLIVSGFIGIIGHLIHHFFEHCFVPLSFICLYYNTLLEVCQEVFKGCYI